MRCGWTVISRIVPTGRDWDLLVSTVNSWLRLGYLPRTSPPRTLNEHILAQKRLLAGDHGLARRLTDKEHVKQWLAELGLGALVVPTIGVYRSIEELRSVKVHTDVIVKPTHSSGRVLIHKRCQGEYFKEPEIKMMESWLREDYYLRSREVNYKGLDKKIIIEPLLHDGTGSVPNDFKVFSTYGSPFMVQVDYQRFQNHSRGLYTIDWAPLDYTLCYPRNMAAQEKPAKLDEMLAYASTVSQSFYICRVDFYILGGGEIKFGEITFFPGNGAERFEPADGDMECGLLFQACLEKVARYA